MSMLEADGVIRTLDAQDYKPDGELKTDDANLSLVVGAASKAEQYIANSQWSLLWRDSDLLFQSPRPFEVYEGSYILSPNVQRFTVAKVVNSVVPQLYKGLFYTDPPMLLRPRPGTSQKVVDAKTALFSYLLDECKFKTETKWGLEQMGHLGTGIWKWGIEYKKIKRQKRTASVATIRTGPPGAEASQNAPTNDPPKIEDKSRYAPRPFFESRPISRVLIDPKTEVGDIQFAGYVVDVRYTDFYELQELRDGIHELPEDHPDRKGWDLPKTDTELQKWWHPPTDAGSTPQLASENQTYADGVHHSEDQNIDVTPDMLRKKLEILEYWDKERKIFVIDRKRVICKQENRFGMIPFFSANWWNRPRAMYGMGLGLIVGQNQRVDQGTINAILKILSFGVNPVYLRKRDSNAPTQMIRTGLGKILTVDGEADKAYHLLDTPKVPSEVWSALQESEKATESTSGADQTLVQGSSAGPRSGMGRTATGASQMAGASATRLDGPLDNFIEQVFKPFLYVLDMLVYNFFSDAEIYTILGEEMGNDIELDFQEFHDARMEYEVLAGASLAAKRTMAQSMTLITQILENPTIQENLAKINGEYIDFKTIVMMWLEASEWKNKNDIIKPLTDEMKQRMQQESQAAQQQSKAALAQQMSSQKFQEKSQLQEQQTNDRIKRDLVVSAFKNDSESEASSGTPSITGLEGAQPTVA